MKKIVLLLSALLALFLFGCTTSQSTASSPGGVLGSPGGTVDNHKVVSFYVIGKGLEPENALTKGEAVLMAERAAVADGYRQLVEKVRGVYVDAFMKAGRGTVNRDVIQVHTQSWLRGYYGKVKVQYLVLGIYCVSGSVSLYDPFFYSPIG